ncbi:MAG: CBS and ACT domain-containing protein [Bacillota bacterium]|nr:CBS and ACT domain-containing protein [Bacillota bacterium]
MLVRDRMTPDPITVTEETNIFDALDLMRRHRIRRLPVMRHGELVGIVTQLDLMRVAPSPATTLSVFELNALLAKMPVKDVMTREVFTTVPEATIEEAVLLMRDRQIGALPVMQGKKLAGIITETNIMDAFIDLMGLKRAGSRVTLEVEDKVGVLADVAGVIRNLGVNILSCATYTPREGVGGVVVRLATPDPTPVVKELESHGYKVVHATALA